MLDRINRLKNWHAAVIIAVLGFAVFFTGMNTPFQGDDYIQIVNNVPVHSITNIRQFFDGGTGYNGRLPLVGSYYRPLMTTTFSLLYTVFGSHTFPFHLFQLVLCLASTILLYLFFRYYFSPALSLFLSLVFLIHPIDSQVVFSIPNMQDALFFFFGILALWILMRYKSVRSFSLVATCLFLSLLSKETGILFVAMSVVYLLWQDRKRLCSFIGVMVVPIVAWLILRIHAIGLNPHTTIAPIDRLNLAGRLLTGPSIMQFYITKFVFPWKLASAYFWVYPTFSIRHFVIPLIIDLAAVALAAYGAFIIRSKASKTQYFTFLFFALWAALGLVAHLQIIPLDMTAEEPYFYFSMAGVLGMIGVIVQMLYRRANVNLLLIVGLVIIAMFGIRTGLRGLDWRSESALAHSDIIASPADFDAYNNLAQSLINQGNLNQAQTDLERSISIYPSQTSYLNLGAVLTKKSNYSGALTAYKHSLSYGSNITLDNNIAALTLVDGNPSYNRQFLVSAVKVFPGDSILWLDLAIQDQRDNNNSEAKIAIVKAISYGHVPGDIYTGIINNKPFILSFLNYDYLVPSTQ